MSAFICLLESFFGLSLITHNVPIALPLGVIRGGKNMIGKKLIIPMEKKMINVTVADPVFLDKENKRINA